MKPQIKYNPKTESLVLRACRKDLTSRDGFSWKNKLIKAPDWSPTATCGQGLHGWLEGQGDPDVWVHRDDDIWLVLAVKTKDIVDLGGKVKFPAARRLYAGPKVETCSFLASLLPGKPVMFARVTAGNEGTATAGNEGTATAGDRGTATAGNEGTATAGNEGTATAGYYGTATAGYGGTATAGDRGTATAGDRGTATAGYGGTATAGDRGTATAGDRGTATAGDYGTATAGDGGTATAGYEGTIQIKWWDLAALRYRITTAYIGEHGIEPNKLYKLDNNHKFIPA